VITFKYRDLAIGLCAGLAIAVAVLLSQKGNVTEQQAREIAYGKAVRACLDERPSGQESICKNLELFNTYRGRATWKDGINHWSFSFSAGTFPDGFNTTIYLDVKGQSLEEKEVLEAS
jgi:hypothetical protein